MCALTVVIFFVHSQTQWAFLRYIKITILPLSSNFECLLFFRLNVWFCRPRDATFTSLSQIPLSSWMNRFICASVLVSTWGGHSHVTPNKKFWVANCTTLEIGLKFQMASHMNQRTACITFQIFELIRVVYNVGREDVLEFLPRTLSSMISPNLNSRLINTFWICAGLLDRISTPVLPSLLRCASLCWQTLPFLRPFFYFIWIFFSLINIKLKNF